MDFVLASASPRRKELLESIGLSFSIEPADIQETVPDGENDAAGIARDLAMQKAVVISTRHPSDIVLAADTIVVFRGNILGKPADSDDARRMLQALRNNTNEVITGVAVACASQQRVCHVQTSVRMRNFSDREIDAYIEQGEPFDKAGGYAIQDTTFNPVADIDGCRCNVIGLPVVTSVSLLKSMGLEFSATTGPLLPECFTCPLYCT